MHGTNIKQHMYLLLGKIIYNSNMFQPNYGVFIRLPTGTPTVYVLPLSLSLYQPDDDPLVGLKHVAIVIRFNQ
jgi:hypothetical protein